MVKYPYKIYMSFQALAPGAEIWINAFYSPKITDDLYHNNVACTDKGSHLGLDDNTDNGDSGSGGKVVDPNNPDR